MGSLGVENCWYILRGQQNHRAYKIYPGVQRLKDFLDKNTDSVSNGQSMGYIIDDHFLLGKGIVGLR